MNRIVVDKKDMNRVIMDYLVTEGFFDAASAFAKETGIQGTSLWIQQEGRIA